MWVCGWLCDVHYVWYWIFCECGYLCGIGVECFEDEEANESERKYRHVGLFENVVFGDMMSDTSV